MIDTTLQSISSRAAPRTPGLVFGAFAISILLLQPYTVFAQQPTGASVVAGTATFATNGNTFTVTNTPNTIINWQSFNIGAGKTTRFEQLSASSTVMNRVVEANPSVILGSLTSNGNVFLVNPNGILFGAGSRVDVGGLVASTLTLSDANFLASNFRFTAVGNPGALTVDGSINSGNGYLALIAPQINVTGAIVAGSAAFGAGAPVEITLSGGQISGQAVGTDLPSASTVFSSGSHFYLSRGTVFYGGNTNYLIGAIVGGGTLADNGGLTLQSGNGSVLPDGGTASLQGGSGGAVSGGNVTLTVQGGGNNGVHSSGGGALTINASGGVVVSGSSTVSLQNGGGGAIRLAGNVPNRKSVTVSVQSASVPVHSQTTREAQAPTIVQLSIEGVRRYAPTISAPVPNMVVAPLAGLAPAQVTLNLSKRESTF